MNRRYLELDSLRGIAAIFVVFQHGLNVLPSLDGYFSFLNHYQIIRSIKNLLLQLLQSGHESVMLFFILSGFVLSLPFYTGKQLLYKSYIIKRVCRIYIPYLIAVLIAIVVSLMVPSGGIPNYSEWFNSLWKEPLSFGIVANHIFLIGYYKTEAYNTAIWSLVHEMRISIIFPLIMIFIIRYSWKTNLLLSIFISVAGAVCIFFIDPSKITNIFLTLHYISFFMIGALLAKYKENLIRFYTSLSKGDKILLFLLALLTYKSKLIFLNVGFLNNYLINDWFIVIGSCIFVITSIGSLRFSSFLNKKPLLFLGEISYSLYLYHGTILFSLIYAFHQFISMSLIFILTIVISLLISRFAYKFIEKSSMKLGKKLTKAKTEYIYYFTEKASEY